MTQQRSDLRVGRRTSLAGLGSLVGSAALGGGATLANSALTAVARADAPEAAGSTAVDTVVDRSAGYEALYPVTGISDRERVERAHGLAPAGEEIRGLFGALAEGRSFRAADGAQWTVEAVYEARGGAIPVVLGARSALGVRVSLELFRDDPSATSAPPARAGGLAAYVTNGGDGATATREQQGLAAMALVRALAARPMATALMTRLSTHSERTDPVVAV